MVTKLKAYAAAAGAAATALQAILSPDTPAWHVVTGVLVILTAVGVYSAPYKTPPSV